MNPTALQILRAALERVVVLQRELFGECNNRPCEYDCTMWTARAALEAAAKAEASAVACKQLATCCPACAICCSCGGVQ